MYVFRSNAKYMHKKQSFGVQHRWRFSLSQLITITIT